MRDYLYNIRILLLALLVNILSDIFYPREGQWGSSLISSFSSYGWCVHISLSLFFFPTSFIAFRNLMPIFELIFIEKNRVCSYF